eukprot:1021312-Prorocentrum_minimum.AAC.13
MLSTPPPRVARLPTSKDILGSCCPRLPDAFRPGCHQRHQIRRVVPPVSGCPLVGGRPGGHHLPGGRCGRGEEGLRLVEDLQGLQLRGAGHSPSRGCGLAAPGGQEVQEEV